MRRWQFIFLTKAVIFCNNNKFAVVAIFSFQFDLSPQLAGLLILICYFPASDGLAADAVAPALERLGLEAFVLQASVSLTAAQRTQSDPKIKAGHYLVAAEAAVRFLSVLADKVSEGSRCQLPVRHAASDARKGKRLSDVLLD
jgi:hypothetical protein